MPWKILCFTLLSMDHTIPPSLPPHDTALTLAAAGGHDELVELLINHGSNIEHRDKKGCTPLILAASVGHSVGPLTRHCLIWSLILEADKR